jgi:hypothetical protein
MLLLLLSKVDNTTIFLMASLNAINKEKKLSSYTVTLLSLLLTTDKRPTRFFVMAWNRQGDLAARMTKPLDGTVTMLASISLTSASVAPCEQWYVVVVSCNQQFI